MIRQKIPKEIKTKEFETIKVDNHESFEVKSNEIVDKENDENRAIKFHIDKNTQTKVEALIPLPPKPKYSYLRKWLLRK